MTKWYKFSERDPPKNKIFLFKKGGVCFTMKYYTKENPHPINGSYGYSSVICDCCDDYSSEGEEMWCYIDFP